ncbi:unnamed protein product [Vitrella brassicaformis CCMP3155]|uniref:Uncharacterized protein n=1 Tax=Vitrella brassicaformis (strain CCMP3155) TaxID=1169540 RepID=A0A0G4FTL8_VITBC|nr:unnamed protein product [Vitrella brassicaformis CCMP3155]|eukprot:CEM18194.1 unnamed protein product [Vitrella brassicaformis CCMP3155]
MAEGFVLLLLAGGASTFSMLSPTGLRRRATSQQRPMRRIGKSWHSMTSASKEEEGAASAAPHVVAPHPSKRCSHVSAGAKEDSSSLGPLPRVVVPKKLMDFLYSLHVPGDKRRGITGRLLEYMGRSETMTSMGYHFWPLMAEMVRQTDWRVRVFAVDPPDMYAHDECFFLIIQKDGTDGRTHRGEGTQFAVLAGNHPTDTACKQLKELVRRDNITQCALVMKGAVWTMMYYDRDRDRLMPTMGRPIGNIDVNVSKDGSEQLGGYGAQTVVDYVREARP